LGGERDREGNHFLLHSARRMITTMEKRDYRDKEGEKDPLTGKTIEKSWLDY
jgi:hypothetical protein